MVITPRVRSIAIAALFVLSPVLEAYGQGPSPAGGPNSEVIPLKVGAIPIANVAPLFLGKDKGFFRDVGLDIQPQFGQGGAAILPAVVSGSIDIGYGNITSVLLARSKGLPIIIIAGSESAPKNLKHGTNAVVVKAGSGINSASDLNGKRVAVNTLSNIQAVTVRAAADKLGADSGTFKFVELDFPDMLPALDAGRVDAIALAEPFSTLGTQDSKNKVLFYNLATTKPGLLIDVYFMTTSYYEKHKDVVDRFRKALTKSSEYAEAHPEEVRATIPNFTKVSKEIASKIALYSWTPNVDKSDLALMSDLMVRYGLISSKPDLDALLAP
jgi:NitT/TauT family transport system substrate-binding protein